MATVNLGRIKFVWQGAYNGATAYVADDVVSYNGSSYICILASTGNLPTNTTYWNQMSSAGTNGTNGTDLTTTLTTQGDIVYRNASGLARLGAGTSGQVLTTQGAGANPQWTTPNAGAYVLLASATASSSSSISFDGYYTSDYDVYEIIGSNIVGDTDSASFRWRVRSSNADRTDAYYRGGFSPNHWVTHDGTGYYNNPPTTSWGNPQFSEYYSLNGKTAVSLSSNHDAGSTTLDANTRGRYSTGRTGHNLNFKITAYNPRSSRDYKMYKMECIWNCKNENNIDQPIGMNGFFTYDGTTSAHSGLSFFPASGTMTSGKFYLYGLKNN